MPVDVEPVAKSANSEIRSAVRHSFVYGIGGVIAKALGFLLLPLYTRHLTTREYGTLEILDLSMSLLGMFMNMGITAALLRYYGLATTEADRKRVVSTALAFVMVSAGTLYLIGLAAIPKVSALMFGPETPSTYLHLSFSLFVLGYIGNVFMAYMQARESSSILTAIETIGVFAILILNVYFIAVLKLGLYGILLSPLLIGGLKVAGYMVKVLPTVIIKPNWPLMKKLITFGAPLVFSNLAMFILNCSDRFFLQRFQSLEVIGIYAVGYKFGYMLTFLLIQPFNQMWQARMYVLFKRPDHIMLFRQVFRYYSVVLVAVGLGLAIFGSTAMRYMVDAKFQTGVGVIPVVSLAYVFMGVGLYLQLGVYLAGRTGLAGMASASAAVVNIIANFFLIGTFGMMGAAWATAIGFLTIAVVSFYCSQKVLPLEYGLWRSSKALLIATGLYWVSTKIQLSTALTTLSANVALFALFPVLIWLCGVFSSDESELVVTLVRSGRRRCGEWLAAGANS